MSVAQNRFRQAKASRGSVIHVVTSPVPRTGAGRKGVP